MNEIMESFEWCPLTYRPMLLFQSNYFHERLSSKHWFYLRHYQELEFVPCQDFDKIHRYEVCSPHNYCKSLFFYQTDHGLFYLFENR